MIDTDRRIYIRAGGGAFIIRGGGFHPVAGRRGNPEQELHIDGRFTICNSPGLNPFLRITPPPPSASITCYSILQSYVLALEPGKLGFGFRVQVPGDQALGFGAREPLKQCNCCFGTLSKRKDGHLDQASRQVVQPRLHTC